MALYLISCDLRSYTTMNQYRELFGALHALGAQRVLLSEWFVRCDETSVALRDRLQGLVDSQDRLLVSEVAVNWAGYNLFIDMDSA